MEKKIENQIERTILKYLQGECAQSFKKLKDESSGGERYSKKIV
jgi:hypothetical protein